MSLTDGIIGCWSPSVRGSGYLLPDLSGRGNHGTLTNMDAGTDWPGAAVRGVHGRVLDYDGTNDFVNCGQRGGDLTESIPFSVSAWAYARAFNLYSALVSRDQSSPFAFAMRVGSGFPSILTDGASVQAGSSVASLVWIHYCAVLSTSRRVFYIDGKAVIDSTASYTITANNEPLSIGTDYLAASDRCWNGQIGETTIFNRALTQAEVMDIYRSGNGAIGRQLTGQTRRRVYGFTPATGARRRRILTGMV